MKEAMLEWRKKRERMASPKVGESAENGSTGISTDTVETPIQSTELTVRKYEAFTLESPADVLAEFFGLRE